VEEDAWLIELEPEVENWLDGLEGSDFAQAAETLDRLARLGSALRMPLSRALGAGLFELRFHCGGVARRITYWFAPNQRVVLLTTFRKQRDNERREVERARVSLRRCAAEHLAEEKR
jgi:hypothetical protein